MGYVYEYDIAAVIIIFAVLINFYRKKTLNTKTTRLFSVLLFVIGFASFFDGTSSYVIENPTLFPMWINYLIISLFYISYTSIPYTFHRCVFSLTNILKTKKKYNIIYSLPYILGIISILVSPYLKTVFYFDENLNYHHGFFYIILYLFCAYHLLHSMVIVIKHDKQFSKKQKQAIAFYTIACVLAIILQAIMDKLMIVCFFSSISSFIIYLSLENPGNFIDKEMDIFNNTALTTTLRQKFESNREFSIVALQIMGINYINDVLGTSIKNQVLLQISNLLQLSCNKNDLYRFSNNKFVILINQNKENQEQLIERLKLAFEEPFRIADSTIPLTLRISTLDCPQDCNNLESVMDLIEISLNSIEKSNSGTVIKANKLLLQGKRQEVYIINTLKHACKNNDFQILYQPIYSLEKEKFVAVETKIRFKNPELQNITARDFIPLAEQNGLILQIEAFALEEITDFICKQKLEEKGIENIFINLSLFQCMQEQLCLNIQEKILSKNINPKLITLSVTEDNSLLENQKVISNMKKIVTNNIKFAIRDYGLGISSANNLLKLPISFVEMDKSLLKNSETNEAARNILIHTMKMIKSLDCTIIANRIESENQLNILQNYGCDFVKGPLFSKVLTENEFVKFLENN